MMGNNRRTQTDSASALQAGLKRIAAAALILGNLVIALIVLKEQWGFLQVLYVCWFEAIIIGSYNLLKMVVVIICGHPFGGRLGSRLSSENRMAAGFFGLIALGVFIAKFAMFALGTGFMLLMLPVCLKDLEAGRHVAGNDLLVMSDGFQAVAGGLPIILLGLVISHGVSFVVNFLYRGEYKSTNVGVLLFWPYARMALVGAVMVLAAVIAALSPPVARTTVFAVTVVGLKLAADLATDAFEHSRQPAVPPLIPAPPVQAAEVTAWRRAV